MEFLDPQKVLAKVGKTPPPEITKLKEQIAAETRLAEFREANDPTFDVEEAVRNIVGMKLQLDRLYEKWIDS